ncbi:MAG: HxlR family transcriptional regulator [Paenibacillus sp.]|nr:HxlR family transcriptional regulator [Paenibacillus sp.]
MANSLEKPLAQQPVQTSEIVANEQYEHKKGARTGPASKEAVCIPCSIEKTLDVIGGKWAFLVLRELFGGTKRFGELQRNINNISPTALTNTLRHMEEKGVLERRVYPTVPVTVEYTLTPKGEDLHPIIKGMKLWAAKWA